MYKYWSLRCLAVLGAYAATGLLIAGLAPQAVVSGVLDFSPAELPDANTWPTHGALRERLLLALKALDVPACHAVRDAFLAELVRLTPPELARLVRYMYLVGNSPYIPASHAVRSACLAELCS